MEELLRRILAEASAAREDIHVDPGELEIEIEKFLEAKNTKCRTPRRAWDRLSCRTPLCLLAVLTLTRSLPFSLFLQAADGDNSGEVESQWKEHADKDY